MARRLDRLVVIDVEATCWEGAPPPGEVNEIIEIGVCTVDLAGGAVEQAHSIIVAPTTSSVSPFCTGLTTLTAEQVAGGVPFAEACARLRREFHTRERGWASWGDYDRRQFERQCAAGNVAYPFGSSHLNLKTLFAMFAGLPHELGMDGALRYLGLPLEGTHHRGVDDAANIARIFSTLLLTTRAGSGDRTDQASSRSR